jgi:hypothetical protein
VGQAMHSIGMMMATVTVILVVTHIHLEICQKHLIG